MDKTTEKLLEELGEAVIKLLRIKEEIISGEKKVTEFTTVIHLLCEEDPPELQCLKKQHLMY